MASLPEEKINGNNPEELIGAYVINLDRSTDRMEHFAKEFASFPIPFIRVSAIEGKKLTIPVEGYDAFMFFLNVGQEPPPAAIGCYLSHIKALNMFLESGKPFGIICEDDAMPTPECFEAIREAIAYSDTWDLCRLQGGRASSSFPYQTLTDTHKLCTSITDMCMAAAYMVNRSAAQKLVKALLPMKAAYDSMLYHGRRGIKEATVFPNCMVLCVHSTNSTIVGYQDRRFKQKRKPWHFVYWTCRLFRLRARVVRYPLQFFRLLQRRFCRRRTG